MKTLATVASDFDRIATALATAPNERTFTRAERFALAQVPPHAKRALDVGCGDGLLTRALADRGLTTVGVDISPGMIDLAQRRSGANPRLDYRVADVMSDHWASTTYDFVVSISMAHHVPLRQLVPRLVHVVAPRGTLVIQDVTTRRGIRGLPLNGVAWLLRRAARLRGGDETHRLIAELYRDHGAGEEYLATSDVAPTYAQLLPGATVSLHLEWRYTVVWHR